MPQEIALTPSPRSVAPISTQSCPTDGFSGAPTIDIKEDSDSERAMIRRRTGLTYEQLCKTVAEGLQSMTAVITKDGTVVASLPANSERAKFVQVAADILAAKPKEQNASKIPNIVIILPNGNRLD